jgi:hypothetical protein
MREFFNTTSQPAGHGFSQANVANDFACYSFTPKTNMPIKVVVLDDTMTDEAFDVRGQGGLDTNHFAWLTNELQLGQDAGQLMIIAAHIPIELVAYGSSTNSAISEPQLLTALHACPNLVMWICGHVHKNNVIPQPSPDPAHPEYGFWEVWTPSLRDFPREFRTFEIFGNTDHTVSILTTDIDPEVVPGSPADVSRGYAIGASRVFGNPSTSLADTNAYVLNAELIKTLTPAMQTVIASCGGPLGHHVAINGNEAGAAINFLGELQSAHTLGGPWDDVTNTSPYTVPVSSGAIFYRAVEQ